MSKKEKEVKENKKYKKGNKKTNARKKQGL